MAKVSAKNQRGQRIEELRNILECVENDYHDWGSDGFDSYSESYSEIVGEVRCSVCGASAELQGDWSDIEDEDDVRSELKKLEKK